MSKRPGTRSPSPPVVQHCACGCGAYADRGVLGGQWYVTAHVPPYLRFDWETGACRPWPREGSRLPLTTFRVSPPSDTGSTVDLFPPAQAGAARTT